MIPYALIRPFLFALDAERAHELMIGLLAVGGSMGFWSRSPTCCNLIEVMVLEFPNLGGHAAALDKNGMTIDGVIDLVDDMREEVNQ